MEDLCLYFCVLQIKINEQIICFLKKPSYGKLSLFPLLVRVGLALPAVLRLSLSVSAGFSGEEAAEPGFLSFSF